MAYDDTGNLLSLMARHLVDYLTNLVTYNQYGHPDQNRHNYMYMYIKHIRILWEYHVSFSS
jgi:hypothetical protein